MDISVIMPVYNGTNYIEKSVESVLKQKNVEFELWLIDDGSTDDSPQKCDAYAKKDPRVHVIHKENAGPGIARNAAIEKANGEYIFFLDCDDWIFDGALAYLYRLAKKHEADIICYTIKKTTDRNQEYPFVEKDDLLFYEGEEVLRRYFSNMTASICKLFRRRIFEKHRFEQVKLCEDAWSMHLFFAEAKKMIVTKTECYVQYFHPDSRSRKPFGEQEFFSENCGLRMVQFAKEEHPDVYGEALYNLIRRQLRLLYQIEEQNMYHKYKKEYHEILARMREEAEDAKKYRDINQRAYKLLQMAVRYPGLYRFRDHIKSMMRA